MKSFAAAARDSSAAFAFASCSSICAASGADMNGRYCATGAKNDCTDDVCC